MANEKELHRDELLVWYDVVEILNVFDAEAQFCWIWIVCQKTNNTGWK